MLVCFVSNNTYLPVRVGFSVSGTPTYCFKSLKLLRVIPLVDASLARRPPTLSLFLTLLILTGSNAHKFASNETTEPASAVASLDLPTKKFLRCRYGFFGANTVGQQGGLRVPRGRKSVPPGR